MMADLVQSQQDYQFTAKPKVVNASQAKFRDQAQPQNNIMWDKRVVRGNTYSSIVTQNKDQLATTKSVRRRPKLSELQELQEDDQDAQQGKRQREHQEVQTDENVEELTDKPPKYEKECQTDFIIEREVPRLYMKVKTGVDKETQVWDDGELFNFEYEVEPILLVIVGKTLEVSRMEVLEEEELKEMDEQQKYYNQLREAEMAEQRRLEDVERGLHEENLRTKQSYNAKKQLAFRAHAKLISRVLAKQFLTKIQGLSMTALSQQGFFRPQIEIELHNEYTPWLYGQIQVELSHQYNAEDQYKDILQNVGSQVQQAHSYVHSLEMKNRAEIVEQRERLKVEEDEKRQKRREERKKRQEIERRQKIKENVIEKLVSKGELKVGALNSTISDINGYQQNQAYIGLFGGILGEFIIFLSALQELANENTFHFLKELFLGPDTIDHLILQVLLVQIQNTEIAYEIGISQIAEQALEELQAGLTIQGLNGQLLTSVQIQQVLQDNMYSIIQDCIKTNYLTFGFSNEIIDKVEHSLLKHCLNDELIRPKVRFVKVNTDQKFDQVCLARVKPNFDDLQFNEKSGKSRPSQAQSISNMDHIEIDEIEIINPQNLAEAKMESKTTVFNPNNEEIRVLVQHSVSELFFRESVIECLTEIIQLDSQSDYHILVEATNKCEAFQNAILDVVAPELPIIDLGLY